MVKCFGHSACSEHSYGADLCTPELILSNTTLPWVILLAAGEAQSAWLVMIFALGGGTPSLG